VELMDKVRTGAAAEAPGSNWPPRSRPAYSPPAEQTALVSRGATALHEASQGPHHWTTLADPEGNDFCV
jgi:hypothetical protein